MTQYFKSNKRREENMKRFMIYFSFTLLLLFGSIGQIQAVTTIDTTPYWNGSDYVWEFGYPNTATYGQVITAPSTSDTVLKSFSFYMNLPSTCTFRGYVYAWDGSKATGSVLYESETRWTSGSGDFEEVAFETGGVALTPGAQYILFASTSEEVGSGVGTWGSPLQEVYGGSSNDYIYINNGSDPSQWTSTNWDFPPYVIADLAFKATFVQPARNILYWNDYAIGTDYMGEALANIANTYSTSVTTATDLADFESKVAAGGWDLVVLMIQNAGNQPTPNFNTYVSGGGRAILADWTASYTEDVTREALFGVTYTGNNNQDAITITDDLLLGGVINPMSLTNPGWFVAFSMGMTSTAGTVAATFANGDAAIVVGANRKTIINGFLTDTPTSASDGVALFENEILTVLPFTVTSANGAERVPAGDIFNLTWIPGAAVSFNVDISTNKGSTWKPLAKQYGDNVLEWWVPLQKNNKSKCLIRVTGFDSNGVKVGQDKSDQVFTIEVVKQILPNGGETWTSGNDYRILWTTNETKADVKSVKLFYTINGGTTWKTITTLSGNPGTYPWTVPSVSSAPKTKCKVKVVLRNAADATIGSDISDAFFTIQP
jgi:hypothetical protein